MTESQLPYIEFYADARAQPRNSPPHNPLPACLDALANILRQQIFIEAAGAPPRVAWRYGIPTNAPPPLDVQARVLSHITEQTGLSWSIETRSVERWILEPAR